MGDFEAFVSKESESSWRWELKQIVDGEVIQWGVSSTQRRAEIDTEQQIRIAFKQSWDAVL